MSTPVPENHPTPRASAPPERHLRAVEQWALVLSAALLGASLLVGDPRWQLGALAGALLSLGNARSLRFLGSRLAPRKSIGLLIVLFQAKLGLIAAFIYLAMRLLPLSPLALLLGLSVLPLSILLRALQYGLRSGSSTDETEPPKPLTESYRES